jgi:hypothetical protein
VKVNSWFFRAMAYIRAVRGQSAISVEFMRMSTGGYSTLAELIADLRPRHGVIRNRRPAERSYSLAAARKLNHNTAIVGTIVPAQSPDSALAASREA